MKDFKLYVTLPTLYVCSTCTKCKHKSTYKGIRICIWQPKCLKWRELARGEWPRLFMRGGHINEAVYEDAMTQLYGDKWRTSKGK